MRTKLLTVSIAMMMICMSLSMVSWTAPAEDVISPFMDKNLGYPGYILDQEVDYTSSNNYQIAINQLRSQTFIPAIDGDLAMISVRIQDLSSTGGEIVAQIREADQAGLPSVGGAVLAETTIPWTDVPATYEWVNITFSNPATLSSGIQYAIVLTGTAGLVAEWMYLSNYYANGGLGWSFDSGASWAGATLDFPFRTYMSTDTTGIKKIAWHPNGDYALGVNGLDNSVWKYTRNTGAWTPVAGTPGDTIFHNIVMLNWISRFILVGEDTLSGTAVAYFYTGSGWGFYGGSPTNGVFYGVESCENVNGYYFVAVGETNTGRFLATWKNNAGLFEVTSGWSGYNEKVLDAAWNKQTDGSAAVYAVGEDEFGYGFMYNLGYPGDTHSTLICSGSSYGPLRAIDWCDDYGNYDYAILAGGDATNSGIYSYNGTGVPNLIYHDAGQWFYDLDFFPDGSHMDTCQVVGRGSANTGVKCSVDMNTLDVIYETISDKICYAIALKGPSSPSSGIISTSSGAVAYYPDAQDTGTQITANAAYPHLYWIGFNETDGTPRVEQQVSPDDWYQFSLAANYSLGWTSCEVVVEAWYDNGNIQSFSNYPAELPATRCLAFRLVYDVGTTAYTITFPVGNEFTTGGTSDNNIGGLAGQEIHELNLEIYLGPQTRTADGSGFGSADPDMDTDKNNALQDANSWDFSVEVRDAGFTTAAETMYAEFGVNKVVSVSVAGNPTGNAPPGSSDVLLSNPSQITYSTNADYWVNASIPDLLESGTGPGSISADNVAIANSNVFSTNVFSEVDGTQNPTGRAFTGANQDWCVWGNRTRAQTYLGAPSNGTVSFGPGGSDFNAAWTNGGLSYTEVNWWITVPGGTNEGIYWAVITITIEAY